MTKINGSDAMLKVIYDWGIDHIYGFPGGSFDSSMNAIYDFRDKMKFIEVRHEEAGALAASAEYKLTGKLGVCFGSAGPGAAHLSVSYTHLTLPTTRLVCRSRWSPYH